MTTQTTTPTRWYPKETSANQGLVIDENTGANIAVTYDAKHAPIIAMTPALVGAVKDMLFALDVDKLKIMAKESGYTVDLFLAARREVVAIVDEIERTS